MVHSARSRLKGPPPPLNMKPLTALRKCAIHRICHVSVLQLAAHFLPIFTLIRFYLSANYLLFLKMTFICA